MEKRQSTSQVTMKHKKKKLFVWTEWSWRWKTFIVCFSEYDSTPYTIPHNLSDKVMAKHYFKRKVMTKYSWLTTILEEIYSHNFELYLAW